LGYSYAKSADTKRCQYNAKKSAGIDKKTEHGQRGWRKKISELAHYMCGIQT